MGKEVATDVWTVMLAAVTPREQGRKIAGAPWMLMFGSEAVLINETTGPLETSDPHNQGLPI